MAIVTCRHSDHRPLELGRQAVVLARRALEEAGEGGVGKHLGAQPVDSEPGTAIHRFAADVPGYRGWEWQAVVSAAPEDDETTISEIALVPAESALTAPEWVPYADRIEPGDLHPGDLLPPAVDDDRLTADPEASATAATDPTRVPLGDAGREAAHRTRYLTRAGLAAARNRWRAGDTGPWSIFARKSERHCISCAFFLPLAAPVDDMGVCANELAADGRVVHARHGCGAHSETPIDRLGTPARGPLDDEGVVW